MHGVRDKKKAEGQRVGIFIEGAIIINYASEFFCTRCLQDIRIVCKIEGLTCENENDPSKINLSHFVTVIWHSTQRGDKFIYKSVFHFSTSSNS